jgi:hypothetical protein
MNSFTLKYTALQSPKFAKITKRRNVDKNKVANKSIIIKV